MRHALRIAWLLLCGLGAMTVARPAHAQRQRLAVETLVDVEGWKTDDGSRLLARNDGQSSYTLRGHGWLLYEPMAGVQLRALGYLDRTDDDKTALRLEGLSLRVARHRAAVLEAGKILMPLGAFGARRFSNTNPLVGAPDMYPTEYPLGALFSGAVGRWDYKAAVVSLPPVNEKYTPAPSPRARPVVGMGWTVGPSFRVGASYTQGSYLGEGSQDAMPPGKNWEQFDQRLMALDMRWSVGYLDTRGEAVWASYDAPTFADPLEGTGWYGEARFTLSPRWFVAGRYEDYAYPFVRAVNGTRWTGRVTRQMNGELGMGLRASADLLFKASLRKDHWPVHTTPSGQQFPDGYALAMQLSWHASVTDLFSRP